MSEVISSLPKASQKAMLALNLEAAEPSVWIYPDVDSLRRYSCASEVALAYYDGAIHLAQPAPSERSAGSSDANATRMEDLRRRSEVKQSVFHEYVHHVLVSNGIGKPIWFQEGAATLIAGDQPLNWYALFKSHRPQVSTMIDDPEEEPSLYEANVYYAQAYAMVDFLERLCLLREPCGLAELARVLATAEVRPEDLFDWAVQKWSSDLSSTAEVSVWDDYMTRGTFGPETYQVLVRRRPMRLP